MNLKANSRKRGRQVNIEAFFPADRDVVAGDHRGPLRPKIVAKRDYGCGLFSIGVDN